mmetsp:Transcript_33171/g.47099  ORF Transcript_33171/g.47099 Transcript_33171/m.47099 type:complete len:110 (+) Transcript_33171:200-529(+)|eukprot:CAMPEP_0202459030 /NCGR_PEP_ID=MMETSP1360-20130828/30288_1 /ASSEMBLY_ACC=CAM_ASM_000848 /TAXON_ID=515479 /ORGANISM="Licmophora paradoxa, Strain CCMP2313" /LENGTH=109 /DNA_ID=CAMNT_0049079857 /DNA_START=66 /DNA_END=395 /DNA_ORIENTATION=+
MDMLFCCGLAPIYYAYEDSKGDPVMRQRSFNFPTYGMDEKSIIDSEMVIDTKLSGDEDLIVFRDVDEPGSESGEAITALAAVEEEEEEVQNEDLWDPEAEISGMRSFDE